MRITEISRKTIVFILVILAIFLTIILDLKIGIDALSILDYFYVVFLTVGVFYIFHPLYVNKRLTMYYWERTMRNRMAIFGLSFIVFLVIIATVGPFFTKDPNKVNFDEKNIPPLGFKMEQSQYDIETGDFTTVVLKGSLKHPLGTDTAGRDILAMIVSGAMVSLQVGLIATGIAISIGSVIGVVSAYFGGWVDNVLMRLTDIIMTFPFFLLLVLIVFIYGPSLVFIILVIGLTGWTGTARLVRSEALSLRTREFIMASKSVGASDSRIVFSHLIPNVISSIIVIATLMMPGVILSEAALSFIGLGDPNLASWGRILKAGQDTLATSWWIAVIPGIMLFLTVLAFNFFGDALRDAFDPRSNI